MTIKVSCNCGKQLKAPDALAGKRAKCPGCGTMLEVPALETLLSEIPVDEFPQESPFSTAGLAPTSLAPSPANKQSQHRFMMRVCMGVGAALCLIVLVAAITSIAGQGNGDARRNDPRGTETGKPGISKQSRPEALRPRCIAEFKRRNPGEEEAIDKIVELGGDLGFGDVLALPSSANDDALVYVERLTSLQQLNIRTSQVTDAGLEHLKGLTGLKWLCLQNTQITDAGLMHLKGLTKLEYVDLDNTQITDVGLEHLKGLRVLKSLKLRDTQVTDSGAEKFRKAFRFCVVHHFKRATALGPAAVRPLYIAEFKKRNPGEEEAVDKIVELGGDLGFGNVLALPSSSDDSLVYLERLTSLQQLSIRASQVTDAGLEQLKELTGLKWLCLQNTQITDAGLVHLKGLTGLEYLDLDNTQITDIGLEHLKGLRLKSIKLRDTQVTDAGAEKFREAFPFCVVHHFNRAAALDLPPDISFPNATTEAPDWLADDPNVPFDLSEFFSAPPPDQNAAPLYLAALCEFSPSLAEELFGPEPPELVFARLDTFRNRAKKPYFEWDMQPNVAPRPNRHVVAEVLRAYQPGMEKLAEAQERPQCVFERDLRPWMQTVTFGSVMTHDLTDILGISGRNSLAFGDIRAAIRTAGSMLQSSRDIRRRGDQSMQYRAQRIETISCFTRSEYGNTPLMDDTGLIAKILGTPGLSTAHCDELIELLNRHRAERIDPIMEACRAEYVGVRFMMQELREGTFQRVMKRVTYRGGGFWIDTSADHEGGRVESWHNSPLLFLLLRLPPSSAKERLKSLKVSWVDPLEKKLRAATTYDEQISAMSPEDYTRETEALNDSYASILELENETNLRRLEMLEATSDALRDTRVAIFLGTQLHSRTFEGPMQVDAMLGATRCLVAVRRWQLDQHSPLPELNEVVQAAGMNSIPIDPFSDKPLRMTIIDRRPIIYSVGPDGKDDRGRVNWDHKKRAGDILFPLPIAESRS